ncbi:hypothetical protein VKT23_014157 [Stygiomarasmius scandens]|uniref:Uncharacterized protein n=1 Tax=Marasmiellus scandens TaxID=2682957 RepID=A0ABR1J4T2_9AGAR
MVSILADLTHNKDSSAAISFTDGLTAAIHERTGTFITSPNCLSIHRPPFGSTRDLYRRADARYGEDDPLQWPQPFNCNNAYLASLPIYPTTPDDPYYDHACLWHSLSSSDLSFTPDGYVTGQGVINQNLADRLLSSVEYVRSRHKSFCATQRRDDLALSLLNEFDSTITLCLNRLTSVSSSLRSHTEGFVEIQRACLYSLALMDYVDIFIPRMSTREARNCKVDRHMGAFVWNDNDALSLFAAGLPVYYVQIFSDFDRQNILEVCELDIPQCISVASSPPYPVIFSGQAGADQKFATIRQASISSYSMESPFQNMHLPGQYSSSYTLGSGKRIISLAHSPASTSTAGPMRSSSSKMPSPKAPYEKDSQKRRGKHPTKNSPKVHRDVFADLPCDHDFVPPPIPAWHDANKTIDTLHIDCRYSSGQRPKVKTIVPDPALIFGPETCARQDSYISQWAHIRQAWLQCCRISQQQPLTVALWRKVLGLNSSGLWTKNVPQNAQEEEHKLATELVVSTLSQYAPTASTSLSSALPVPSNQQAKQLIRELSLINFRFQLSHLDELLDTSRPQPSSSLTHAELGVALANHRRKRVMLIEVIFGGSRDLFTLPSLTSNHGFASDKWRERVEPLRSFWTLLNSWPGTKPSVWNRGEDENLPQMERPREEWVRALVCFYVQAHFNYIGYAPVLPRRI